MNASAKLVSSVIRLQMKCLLEMRDGLRPLLRLACQLSQHEFRAGVGGIDSQFLFELPARLIHGRRLLGLRQQQAAHTVMDAGHTRILG